MGNCALIMWFHYSDLALEKLAGWFLLLPYDYISLLSEKYHIYRIISFTKRSALIFSPSPPPSTPNISSFNRAGCDSGDQRDDYSYFPKAVLAGYDNKYIVNRSNSTFEIAVRNPVGRVGIVDFYLSNLEYGSVWSISITDGDRLGFVIPEHRYLPIFVAYDGWLGNNIKNIFFEIGGNLRKAVLEDNGYNESWGQRCFALYPSYETWIPTPEPSTYGAVIAASSLGLVVFRRRRNGPIPSKERSAWS